MKGRENNLPSEFDDFSASVCAANAFVRSNKSSWNCFESVVVDKSTDLKILQMRKREHRVNIKNNISVLSNTQKIRGSVCVSNKGNSAFSVVGIL